MTEQGVFNVRLALTITATVSTALAAGAVTFALLGVSANHDLQSVSTLVALGCNTALTGMATRHAKPEENTPPPPSSKHPSDGQG